MKVCKFTIYRGTVVDTLGRINQCSFILSVFFFFDSDQIFYIAFIREPPRKALFITLITIWLLSTTIVHSDLFAMQLIPGAAREGILKCLTYMRSAC